MGWLIFAGYFIGWLVGARVIFKRQIDDIRDPNKYDRSDSAFMGLAAGLLWPLVLLYLWVIRPTPSEKRVKKRKEEYRQRIETKRLAREYNLPFGMEQNEKKEISGSVGDRDKYPLLVTSNRGCNTCGDSGLCGCL